MKKQSITRGILFVYLLSFFLFTGFDQNLLAEIEVAFINNDYELLDKKTEKFLDSKDLTDVPLKVMYYLGISQLRKGHYDKAREILQRVVQQAKTPSLRQKALLGLADAFFLEQNYEESVRVLESILEENPTSDYLSLVYLKYAKAQLKLANWAKAREYLGRIITIYPKSMEIFKAKQLLQEKQYFAVQVGSFIERDKAQQLILQLKKDDEYAYIVETSDRQNRKFYRVRVGQLALLDEAQKVKDRLISQGYPARIYP